MFHDWHLHDQGLALFKAPRQVVESKKWIKSGEKGGTLKKGQGKHSKKTTKTNFSSYKNKKISLRHKKMLEEEKS